MYKSFSKKDFQKILGLSNDYKVAGFLSCGTWEIEEQLARLEKSLTKMGKKFQIDRQIGYLQNVFEIRVDGLIYWFVIAYGGVILSEYLHMACLFGSKKNIHVGSCGGLYPKMESTDFLVPTWSHGDESPTRLYDRDNKEHIHLPDKKLSEIIKLKMGKEKVWEGPIITCTAMLAETEEDVKQWSENGFYGVEMETSTVFAVSKHFGVPAASLVFVIDNLIKGQVVGDESYNQQKEARDRKSQKMFDITVTTLLE